MTGAAQLTFPAAAPIGPRIKQIGITATTWLIVANICIGAPLVAFWAGSQVERSGDPSMASIVVVVLTLAAVGYGLVALLWRLKEVQDRLEGAPPIAETLGRIVDKPEREPLVLVDGGPGGGRPWRDVLPHLDFGFDVLTAVLPKNASIDTTLRAMDRAGWVSAHIVARPRDAHVAVDLARLGRASSLCLLDTDAVGNDPAGVATAIAEYVTLRRSG